MFHFDSFLSDFKRKSRIRSIQNISFPEWVLVFLAVVTFLCYPVYFCLGDTLGMAASCWVGSVLCGLELAFFEVKRHRKSSMSNTHPSPEVKSIEELLDDYAIDPARNESLDKPLSGCDNKLAQPWPSETLKKQSKLPLRFVRQFLVRIIFSYLGLPKAWIDNIDTSSPAKMLVTLTISIILLVWAYPELLPLCIVLFIIAIIAYISITLFLTYIVVPFLDRDWLRTQELKEILLYIKAKSSDTPNSAPDTCESPHSQRPG